MSSSSSSSTSLLPGSATPGAGRNARTIRVVTRGDDAASSLSANRGIREACEHGILRNVSVMVPGGFLQDASEQLGHLHGKVAFGLHVCLNAEWDSPRWGPVSPREKVPSLLAADGCFPTSCNALASGSDAVPGTAPHGALLSEMMLEVRAQLNAMRAAGFRPVYMDEHMGVGWVNGLAGALREFAAAEGLIFRPATQSVKLGGGTSFPVHNNDLATPFLDFLRTEAARLPDPHDPAFAETGAAPFLVIMHPTYNDDEMRSIRSRAHPPGHIAADREAQRIIYTRNDVKEFFQHSAQAIRYDEI